MSTPPRRRRTEPQRPDGSGWLPTIAMGLGVIVAGLGIGALIAVLMQRHSAVPPVAITAPTRMPAALPVPTLAPVALATTAAPVRRPTPRPVTPTPAAQTAAPSPSATPAATPTPAATLSAAASPAPRATRTAVALPSSGAATPAAGVPRVAMVTAAPRATRVSAAEPVATASPIPATPVATVVPTVVPALVTTSPAAEPSAYDQHASAVVRRYIDALIRGDQQSAYSALGQSAGATGSLPEQAFLDASAHIVSLKVTRIDAANATVGCEIASARGHYYGTYHVTAGSGGPYISEHDYIKV